MSLWSKAPSSRARTIQAPPQTAPQARTTPAAATSHRHVGGLAALLMALPLSLAVGCKQQESNRAALEAPPSQPQVVSNDSANSIHVDNARLFPLIQASTQEARDTLNVTGSVMPDVSRELPVLSIANGRVVALHVGLGDTVRKGQLIMDVQSPDVATAFAAYLKAVADEHLTLVVLNRDKLLYDKGAIAQSQLEIAQDGEDDAVASLKASEQQLNILGVDRRHPGDVVHVYAPAAGVIIAQNTTAAGAAGISFAGATGSFIIADLSHVWVVCDVYENDLAQVHLGESVTIHLSAFSDKVLTGTISDIGAALDPSLRTAKVRIQVQNPDRLLRLGMFATATFQGAHAQPVVAIPGNAILRLHDSAFVFEPGATSGDFRRVAVKTGRGLENNLVEVLSGLTPGQQIVANALELQNTADQ